MTGVSRNCLFQPTARSAAIREPVASTVFTVPNAVSPAIR